MNTTDLYIHTSKIQVAHTINQWKTNLARNVVV